MDGNEKSIDMRLISIPEGHPQSPCTTWPCLPWGEYICPNLSCQLKGKPQWGREIPQLSCEGASPGSPRVSCWGADSRDLLFQVSWHICWFYNWTWFFTTCMWLLMWFFLGQLPCEVPGEVVTKLPVAVSVCRTDAEVLQIVTDSPSVVRGKQAWLGHLILGNVSPHGCCGIWMKGHMQTPAPVCCHLRIQTGIVVACRSCCSLG